MMKQRFYARLLAVGSVLGTAAVAHRASALTFNPLSGDLPVIGQNWASLPDIINAFLGLTVGVAAILAVIMLSIGGFKYMTSESMFRLGDAREQIANAIIGLLIVLAAVLILKTINPQLVSLNVLNF